MVSLVIIVCYLDCVALDLWWKVLPYSPFPFGCVAETSYPMLSSVVRLHFLGFFFICFLSYFSFLFPQSSFMLKATCHLISLLLGTLGMAYSCIILT